MSWAELWGNATLWLPVGAATVVQIVKLIFSSIKLGHLDFRVVTQAGGMPSSHAAVVTALATAVAMREGVGSALFATTVILALVVMYDAAGVRQAAGRQARVLNQIVDELFAGHPIREERLRELLGHTPFEVIVGGIVGILFVWLWLTFIGPAY